jgi:protein-L-isoaspartate(D-aspartate) O-methyltransferase
MFDFTQARTNMVDSQLRPNGITDSRILDAMQAVRREDFVPQGSRDVAYMDGDVPLKGAATPRYLIEPMAFAKMLQLADVRESDRVLDVGCATGYGAAVLAQLAGHVVALESDVSLMAAARENLKGKVNVSLMENTLSDGAKSAGPFDLILIEGRVENMPEALFSQLTSKDELLLLMVRGMFPHAAFGQTQVRRTRQDQRLIFRLQPCRALENPRLGLHFNHLHPISVWNRGAGFAAKKTPWDDVKEWSEVVV